MSIALTAVLWAHVLPSVIPNGSSKLDADVSGRRITLYTYKPDGYRRDGRLVLVFHGLARNAEEYRDFARGLADRTGSIIAAREFDEDQFPYEKYTRGGVRDADGGSLRAAPGPGVSYRKSPTRCAKSKGGRRWHTTWSATRPAGSSWSV